MVFKHIFGKWVASKVFVDLTPCPWKSLNRCHGTSGFPDAWSSSSACQMAAMEDDECIKLKEYQRHIWMFPKIGVPPNNPF